MWRGGSRPGAASCCVVTGPSGWHHDFLEAEETGAQIRSTEGTMTQGHDSVWKPDPKTEARTVLRAFQTGGRSRSCEASSLKQTHQDGSEVLILC